MYCMFTETGVEGTAISSFIVNSSPVHGSCTIRPENGIEMITDFTVLCKGWRDEVKYCGDNEA